MRRLRFARRGRVRGLPYETAGALRWRGIAFDGPYRPADAWPSADAPRLTLATIHGAKGRQADVVYVIPELSKPSWKQWRGRGRDEIRRLFYVAFTRAREELVLLYAATDRRVRWPLPR